MKILGLYGIYFPKNRAAFSAATISQTMGFVIGSTFSTYMSTSFKTWFYVGISVAGLLGYMVLAVKYQGKSELSSMSDSEKEDEKVSEHQTIIERISF